MIVRVLDRYTLWGQDWCRVLLDDGSTSVIAENEFQGTRQDLTADHLRYLALAARIREELESDNVAAAYGSSLLPLPHQVLVLERVLESRRTRFLLADEVGLGKTIEAGLVIKELKLRGKVRRVLIIVPHALVAQWQSEMRQRFGEIFRIILPSDLGSVTRLLGDEQDATSNPWRLFDQVIVPMDTVKPRFGRSGLDDPDVKDYNKLRFDDLVSAGWDLVVVDECHKLAGYAGRMARNILGDAIAQAAPRVLLLSATPHQGKSEQFRRLLHILDPETFAGNGDVDRGLLSRYILRTEKRKALDYDGKCLFHERRTHTYQVDLDPLAHPGQFLFEQRMNEFLRATYARVVTEQKAMLGFLVLLLMRMANSSTVAGLDGLTNRLAVLQGGTARSDLFEMDDMTNDDVVMEVQPTDRASETSWITELIQLAKVAQGEGTDVKATELIRQIDALRAAELSPDLKVLIFTEFKATQQMLRRFLENRGYNVVLVNGEMSPDERMAAQNKFAGAAQILISTDAGGEGVNLQFCHIVFNYDLPWNPMKIEQRIGRVDRIGQSSDVTAVNLVISGSVDDKVQEVLTTKLATILSELGIDKAGDVLDSSIDTSAVERLYLQSLLDPDTSGSASDEFLATVREKLRDYKATADVLPVLEQADPSRAAAIAHNPMPYWCERMVTSYLSAVGESVSRDLFGYVLVWPDGMKQENMTFHAQPALEHGCEQLTAHSERVRLIVENNFVFGNERGLPAVPSAQFGFDLRGTWSLWRVTARTSTRSLGKIIPVVVGDDGQALLASGQRVLDFLCGEKPLNVAATLPFDQTAGTIAAARAAIEPLAYQAFHELTRRHELDVDREDEGRQAAFNAQQQLIDRIALENVRGKRQRDLETARKAWNSSIEGMRHITPELECVLAIRLLGTSEHV